jgi:hypothetical protein
VLCAGIFSAVLIPSFLCLDLEALELAPWDNIGSLQRVVKSEGGNRVGG